MTTWRNLIAIEMKEWEEDFNIIEGMTLTDKDLDKKFNCGYGSSEGCDFTLWTKNRVYFPVIYDGAEWVGSVPRNPCNEASEHHGGE